ncbi:hypothetical protein LSTR_LSTR003222 [Laodelphax striatellus]|uniref:Uncharacterized protein n=1 Tax=Laodelphax striatellus TaxID=195883 RepID=A0A482XS78_LAOST|nr:hypothetical protein LSTR_LSTR003222 [Laodelphax striatellus]
MYSLLMKVHFHPRITTNLEFKKCRPLVPAPPLVQKEETHLQSQQALFWFWFLEWRIICTAGTITKTTRTRIVPVVTADDALHSPVFLFPVPEEVLGQDYDEIFL